MRATPNAAECAIAGFTLGLTAGVVTGHFVLALAPAILVAAIFALVRVALGLLYDQLQG